MKAGWLPKANGPSWSGWPLMGAGDLFLPLGGAGLMDPDEGRYAEMPGRCWSSRLAHSPPESFPYLEKPPLVYWLTALSFKVLGPSELAARLPSALSAPGRPFSGLRPGPASLGSGAGLARRHGAGHLQGYVILGGSSPWT